MSYGIHLVVLFSAYAVLWFLCMVGLAACSCSYGRVFAFGPFASNPHGSDLAYSFS